MFLYASGLDVSKVIDLYDGSLRLSMFTAFLTLSGLLLTVKSFLFTNILRDIYSDEDYQKEFLRLEKQRRKNFPKKNDAGKGIILTETLKNINWFFIWAISVCLITSLYQVTIGLAAKGKPLNPDPNVKYGIDDIATCLIVSGAFILTAISIIFISLAVWRLRTAMNEILEFANMKFTKKIPVLESQIAADIQKHLEANKTPV